MLSAVSNMFRPLQLMKQVTVQACYRSVHTINSIIPAASDLLSPQCLSITSIRTKVRCYFPRPNEVQRVRRHGWETRMKTSTGRRIIMRRLLKGRYVLSH